MDAAERKIELNRLNNEVKKSLSKLRLSSTKKLSYADKLKIKKAANKGIENYFKQESKRVNAKAFDWYFDKTLGRVYRQRNGTHKNRYFIVEFHKEISLNSDVGTYIQRTREIFTSDVEFSAIISSSEKNFAKLYNITVDAEEKKKIWKAFDNVDEKTIFAVTLGIPLAVIFIAEIAPVLAVEAELMASYAPAAWSEYTAATTFTASSILETSVYSGLVNGGTNLAGQYVYNDYKFDENINWLQPAFAATTKGLVSNLGESSFDLEMYYDDKQEFHMNFKGTDSSTFYGTFFSNILGNQASAGMDNLIKPLNDFTPVFKSTFDIIGGTVIETTENKVGEEISSKIEKN